MKDLSKIGLALLAGAVAGAVAGILLAPQEGAETRRKLARKAKKMEGQLKDKAKEFGEKAKEFSEKAAEKAKDFSEMASEKAKEFKGKAEGFMSKANDVKNDAIKTAEGYL